MKKMKIISTNIGEPRIVNWKGKEVETGIFNVGGAVVQATQPRQPSFNLEFRFKKT